MDYQPVYLYKTLSMISKQSSIDELLELGLNFSQIAEHLSYLISNRWIEDHPEKGLILTDEGQKKYLEFREELFFQFKDKIIPLNNERATKLEKFDIYLPIKKNIPYHTH
jgi:hypothetical protein